MVPWIKSALILMLVAAIVLPIAYSQGWPIVLLIPGFIIGLLSTLLGYFSDTKTSRKELSQLFVVASIAILLSTFLTEQVISYGFRTVIANILTGDGPPATNPEIVVFWTLVLEIFLCGMMIGFIRSRATTPNIQGRQLA